MLFNFVNNLFSNTFFYRIITIQWISTEMRKTFSGWFRHYHAIKLD